MTSTSSAPCSRSSVSPAWGLYVFWYRNLKPDAIAAAEDEAFADPIERVRALTGEGKA